MRTAEREDGSLSGFGTMASVVGIFVTVVSIAISLGWDGLGVPQASVALASRSPPAARVLGFLLLEVILMAGYVDILQSTGAADRWRRGPLSLGAGILAGSGYTWTSVLLIRVLLRADIGSFLIPWFVVAAICALWMLARMYVQTSPYPFESVLLMLFGQAVVFVVVFALCTTMPRSSVDGPDNRTPTSTAQP